MDDHGGAHEVATSPLSIETLLAIPRVEGLLLSPDGRRLVTQLRMTATDGRSMASSLWEVDPHGAGEPRRLTRSTAGENLAAFLPDGSLLFTSTRRDPDTEPPTEGDEPARLWRLPAGGGEAEPLTAAAGGIEGVWTARHSASVLLCVPMFPGAPTLADDAERGRARREAGVSARLVDSYPLRWWDHWRGPRYRRLLLLDTCAAPATPPRDLAPDVGTDLLDEATMALAPDGQTAVAAWARGSYARFQDLVAIDVASGARCVLCAADRTDFGGPVVSPDSRWVACVRTRWGDSETAVEEDLWVVPLSGGEGRTPMPSGIELHPRELVVTPDSRAVLFVADDHGDAAVFRLGLDAVDGPGTLTRLTAGGAYASPQVSPDGTTVFAVRSTPVTPPEIVALDATTPGQEARALRSPSSPLAPPCRLERVVTDHGGVVLEGWLALPPDASAEHPVPLVLAVHGGPVSSWTGWSWRWNMAAIAAHGYAVLAPDPALSTGYGQNHIQRGWRQWGGAPYADLMAVLDVVLTRADVDADRTAVIGGSYGGYMANWIAGHTTRFRCIVSHASVWSLDQMWGTSDFAPWVETVTGDPHTESGMAAIRAQSPDVHGGAITTPMLVIHGELDHRVPISEALRLMTDLIRTGAPVRLLHFPDENHWILKPQNARLWYDTVLAFLGEHLLDRPFERSTLL